MTHPVLENWSEISQHPSPVLFQPDTESDLQQFLRASRQPCLLAGNGSKWWMGNSPLPVGACVDLRRFDRVLEYSPGDLTVTVEAGIPFSKLEETLASEMQTLPVDPPAARSATMGGMVAVGLSGPLQQCYGTLRDKVLGVKVIHPDGTITRAGGKVVKNVAGYDLCKLYCGSFGTLVAILEVTFRVFPRTDSLRCVRLEVENLDQACGVWRDVRKLAVNPAGMIYLEEPSQPRQVVMRFQGTARSVDAQLSEVRAAFYRNLITTEDVLETAIERFYSDPLPLRLRLETLSGSLSQTVPLAQRGLTPRISLVDFSSRRGYFSADSTPVDNVQRIRNNLKGMNAALVIEKAPLSIKSLIDVWGSTRGDLFLTQAIKATLDPERRFNPGRYVTGT